MTSEFSAPYAGRMLLDRHGERIGRIEAVYVDAQTERPHWGLVHFGFRSSRQTLVPLVMALPEDGVLRVPWDRRHIRNAPTTSLETTLSGADAVQLARHYSIALAGTASGPAVPPGGNDLPAAALAAEGRPVKWPLRSSPVRRPSELVRVRRTHLEQPVSQRVRLRREEVRIEQEAALGEGLDRDHEGLDRDHLAPASWELTLMREEPIVRKRRVPVEHVRVESATEVGLAGRSVPTMRVVRDRAGGAVP